MRDPKKKKQIYASPAQTQRWIKCLLAWAKANNKTYNELTTMLGFKSRITIYRLAEGKRARTRISLIQSSIKEFGLDANYIYGVYDFKSKFSEARNIFTEFKELYAEYKSQGNFYQSSQIVRKAAMFVFETLVPKDILLHLEFTNRKNEYESASVTCSSDDKNFFRINIFGGPHCVMFTMSKLQGNMELPIMEGDLDIHALSSIRLQVTAALKGRRKVKKEAAQFEDNAKKFAI
ncbi:MAG: hypothetical protein ABFD50_21695 [Smithella sp.]